MSSVLVATLIADSVKAPLSEATLDRAAQALRGVERRRWLDEGVAADLVFTGDLKAKRAALDDALAGEPVDVIVQPLRAPLKAPSGRGHGFDADRPGMR